MKRFLKIGSQHPMNAFQMTPPQTENNIEIWNRKCISRRVPRINEIAVGVPPQT